MERDDPSTGNEALTVYWRPGCIFCLRLRLVLRLKRLHPRMINIWSDPDAAGFVRSVADGNETVPTVVIDGRPLVNPSPGAVVAALRGDGR
ncbi:MAG TPA: glutaredoxin domain-containing protein [Acidimicrobiales bacterium]